MSSVSPGSTDSHSVAVGAVRTRAARGVVPVGPGRTGVVSSSIIDTVWVFPVITKTSMVVSSVRRAGCGVTMARHFISRERTDSMSVFQILKNNVLIIDGDRTYSDTVDNFLTDAGAVSVPESVVYDDDQECCVVDGEFLTYPNGTYSGYCDRIQALLDAQAKRTYVAPAAPTTEDQKAALKADYDSAVKELTNSMAVALLTGDTAAQESIRADFSDLQKAYKEAMDDVQSTEAL